MGGNKEPVNVNDAKRKTFFRNCAVAIIVFVVFFTLPSLCGAHGNNHHGHSHDEPASFKYSKQANEELLREEHHHGHHHHGHEHSHDSHDHGHHHAETTSKNIPLGLLCHNLNKLNN